MAKLEKIEKKVQQYFLAEEERLISQGEESRLEYFRKMQEKSEELFARFAHHKVFEDRSLRAVVGFGEDGVLRYWNPKEGNLLVCGPASGGFVAQGNLLALLSLCRFSEEELHWFYVARESASGFFAEDSHCKGSGALWQGNCGEAFASLRAEIDKRLAMSEELLGKTPEELTVAECAMLAAIIKNPAGYSPVNHPEACKNRRNLILKLMLDQEYIGEKEYAAACASPLGIKTAQKDYAELYVNSVYAEAADKLGITPSAVKNGGYEIQTYYLQSKQKALYENLHDGNLYAPGDNATYGAAIMCDNASKGISAYYSIDNTLAGQMRRQGASVVKPLLVYAPAMETGAVSPATQIMDEPVDFGGYAPENYGKNYSGRISVRQAVKESSNVSAVKVMTYITPEKAAEYAEKMNISLTDEDKNLTLALGSTRNGFTLNELAGGYLTLANRGEYLTPQFIKSIKKNGKTLYERKTDSVRVFSDSTAYLMTDILKDTATDGTAKALRVLGIPIAAKTGTASVNGKNTDAWCASYTTEDTLIVWHGSKNYSSETAMPSSETGGAFATKTAAAIYKEVYGGRILSDFVMSADTVMLKLDKTDLENQKITLASEQTPLRYTVSELFDIRYAPDTVSLNFTELKVANLRLSPYPGGCTVQFEAKPFLEYEICKNNILGDRILYTVTESDGDVSVNIEDNNLNDYYIKVGFINDLGQKICGEHQYLTENDENNSHYKENKKNRPKFFGLF